ncbi:hypothetical protein ELI_05470 [Erythrobacter litoralis HTCC2594]|uniref:Uncharacterized protein n=1 Tax=Erythrobacter litoralis (strain HTCC2594) TaxID=314225 RepID=Q2NAV5_ERYLH|nr:hypothetical protein ELI_05470 [Erythrobacter litoralis HTCC2594]
MISGVSVVWSKVADTLGRVARRYRTPDVTPKGV